MEGEDQSRWYIKPVNQDWQHSVYLSVQAGLSLSPSSAVLSKIRPCPNRQPCRPGFLCKFGSSKIQGPQQQQLSSMSQQVNDGIITPNSFVHLLQSLRKRPQQPWKASARSLFCLQHFAVSKNKFSYQAAYLFNIGFNFIINNSKNEQRNCCQFYFMQADLD